MRMLELIYDKTVTALLRGKTKLFASLLVVFAIFGFGLVSAPAASAYYDTGCTNANRLMYGSTGPYWIYGRWCTRIYTAYYSERVWIPYNWSLPRGVA